MTYTQIAVASIVLAVLVDLFVLRTSMIRTRVFWASYAIMFGFQLLTNGVLTGYRVVTYDGVFIIGNTTPTDGPPPLLGEGRIAYAPVEDLMFGFSLILLTIGCWVWLGRRGVQYRPQAGPPVWRRRADQAGTRPGP